MSETIMYISFKLVKGASIPDFLIASEKLNNEYMSKQKGYISWKQLVEKDMWVDLITWESMEDAQRILDSSNPTELAKKFYSFINCNSCKVHLFSVEKTYK